MHASYALHIADTAIEMGINPATDLKVRAGIFGAEPCSQGMRDEIAEKLGVQYCDVYGLSEVMGGGRLLSARRRAACTWPRTTSSPRSSTRHPATGA